MRARLENTTGGSSKFWEVAVDGKTYTVKYGKLDGKGAREESKTFATPAEALAEAQRVSAKKLKDGYTQVSGDRFDGAAAASAAQQPVGAVPPPTGSVAARALITGARDVPKTDGAKAAAAHPVADAFIAAAKKDKQVPVAALAKLLKSIDAGKLTAADAKPAFAAWGALCSRSDFVKTTFGDLKYAAVAEAALTVADAATRAIAGDAIDEAQLVGIATAMGARAHGNGQYGFFGAVKEVAAAAEKDRALRPFAQAMLEGGMDEVIAKGKDPLTFLFFQLDAKEWKRATFWWVEPYVAKLGARVDPASADGANVARGLRRLEHYDWVVPGTTERFLQQAPNVHAAVDALRAAFDDGKHTVAESPATLAGFDTVDGRVIATDADRLLVPAKGGAAKELANTDQYRPLAVRADQGRLLVLTENTKQNAVAHLQVYDATTGARLGSNVLPRPANHLVGRSAALDGDGAILFASSDSGSQDSLARVAAEVDPKGKLAMQVTTVDADTTEGAKRTGYKLRAVTVDGARAIGVLNHEANNSLRLVEYRLPKLDQARALNAEPIPFVGNPKGVNQIAATPTHLFVAGDHSITVLARENDGARMIGALPVNGVEDVRARPDGGLDLVLHSRSFQLGDDVRHPTRDRNVPAPTSRIVRLSAAETRAIFVSPFA